LKIKEYYTTPRRWQSHNTQIASEQRRAAPPSMGCCSAADGEFEKALDGRDSSSNDQS
jgi:hypothetical protein